MSRAKEHQSLLPFSLANLAFPLVDAEVPSTILVYQTKVKTRYEPRALELSNNPFAKPQHLKVYFPRTITLKCYLTPRVSFVHWRVGTCCSYRQGRLQLPTGCGRDKFNRVDAIAISRIAFASDGSFILMAFVFGPRPSKG